MTLNTALHLGTLSLAGAAVAVAQDITNNEREQALRFLADSRNGVVEAVKGLSEAQWTFKPAPDRWSVAEILEHIAVGEELIFSSVRVRLETAPVPSKDRDPKAVDALVLAKVPDRSTKFQSPPHISPTGRWTPSVTLEHFLAARQQNIAYLKSSTDLRAHAVDHPVFGPLDGYQWILAAAGHSARHTKQILEVKADPNFPRN